jgi:DNA-binding PadR family transcriptional regulator
MSILAMAPKNGVEIMNSIEQMTQGWWRPSPGSLYPMLETLENEGLIKKNAEDRYELTQQSKDEMDGIPGFRGGAPQDVEGMLTEISGYISYFEDLSRTDRTKVESHRDQIRRIADRLNAIVQGGR